MTNKTTHIKSLTFIIALFCAVHFGFGQINDLIISEYVEGSANNKYLVFTWFKTRFLLFVTPLSSDFIYWKSK